MKTRSALAGMFTAASVLAFALVLSACGSSNPAPTPAPVPDGTLAGNAVNGGPVAGATVMVTPTGGGTAVMATTDAAGDYTVDVPPGNYDVLAYKDVMYDDFTANGVAVVSSATTTQDITFVPLSNTYVGSAVCWGCHDGSGPPAAPDVTGHELNGHPFKLNKIVGAVAPTYPFTDLSGALTAGLADDGTDIAGGLADPNGTETDNTLGTPSGWADITYTIGGFGWKARQIDAAGYIVTGSAVQYNYWNGTMFDWLGGGGIMSGYHNNEVDKVFNCGNCHTTGWRRYDATLNPARQDGLAGMDGTFSEPGIRCEACHGAGSKHAASMSPADIVKRATPRTLAQLQHHSAGYGLPIHCGECHTRDGERDYPTYMSAANGAGWAGDANWAGGAPIGGRIAASGGFVRHHEQYDELLGLDPDNPSTTTRNAAFAGAHGKCESCHDDHMTTRFQDVSGTAPGIATDCTACHTNNATSTYTLTEHVVDTPVDPDKPTHCIDCHMPHLTKSALATYTPPAGSDRPSEGDVRSHIFRINLQRDPANQFTASGGFAYPELTGQHVCQRCHDATDGVAFALTFPRPAGSTRIHAP